MKFIIPETVSKILANQELEATTYEGIGKLVVKSRLSFPESFTQEDRENEFQKVVEWLPTAFKKRVGRTISNPKVNPIR